MPSPKMILASKSASILQEPIQLNTLADLVGAAATVLMLASKPSAKKRREWLWKLRSGGYAISHFLNDRKPEEILISEILKIEVDLDEHLKRTTTPAMRNRLIAQYRLLLKFAKALGWSPRSFAVEDAWERTPLKKRGIRTLLRHLIGQGLRPDQVTEPNLAAWVEDSSGGKSTRAHRRKCVWQLKLRIRQSGAQENFSQLDVAPSYSLYSIATRKMNPKLWAALQRIQKRFGALDRRALIRKNSVTRDRFIRNADRLYGYCVNIRHMSRDVGLEEIFSPDVLSDFARWLSRSRGWKRTSLSAMLCSFHSTLSNDPHFRNQDLHWMLDLIKEFRPEPESEKETRDTMKAFDYDYDALAVIPELLRDKWKSSPDLTREARGWLIHDCLLMLWLLTFPWPPACLRRCRISGRSRNLVRRRSPQPGPHGRKHAGNSRAAENRSRWYFKFTAREVPMGHSARGPLPLRLIPLLELYLKYRRYLLRGRRTSTLFLNRAGGEMNALTLYRLVGDITEKFVQWRVPPAAFRPIFAYHWLQQHPGDYTNLASILWEGLPAIKLRFDRGYRMSLRARVLARRRQRT